MARTKSFQRRSQAGFTLVELMVAIVLLLVGLVAVAQLIPAAMQQNTMNRFDSSGLIAAQRLLEQMMAQPMDVGNPAIGGHYSFTASLPNGVNAVINLGLNGTTGVCPPPAPTDVGAPVVALSNGELRIDWGAGVLAPAGYSAIFTSAERTVQESNPYEARWRVMTFYECIGNTARPVGKRILLSTRGGPPGTQGPPTTLITMVGMNQ